MKEIIGNILTPNTDESLMVVVCHQVNCKGVMGSGLARQVKERFPHVYRMYTGKCSRANNGPANLGDVQRCYCTKEAGCHIANIFGQYEYGRTRRHTDYIAVATALRRLGQECKAVAKHSNITPVIRIPYQMSSGLAGGDWSIIRSIIKTELVEEGLQVEIWRLK